MPEGRASASASRSAFLELRDELNLVYNGYEFLDEKRVQLASEMLRQRSAYRDARATFIAASEKAAAALLDAAAAEGIDALQVLPASALDNATVKMQERKIVGLALVDARFDAGKDSTGDTLARAPGLVRDCADAFRDVVATGVPLAAMSASLERLMYEYVRTERRVRALENVILPEIRGELSDMEEQLDLNEQEEVIRVHAIQGTG